jgi:hypothetical protein
MASETFQNVTRGSDFDWGLAKAAVAGVLPRTLAHCNSMIILA